MKRKTVGTLAIIAIILSFFLTPLGDLAKSWLMRKFAPQPGIIKVAEQDQLKSYDWRLKDERGMLFNFSRSKGKVVFIDFWSTWHTPSAAELYEIQKLYNEFEDRVDFYMVTNEERAPVVEFMDRKGYSFPVTYRMVDEPAPLVIPNPSGSYIIDKLGNVVVKSNDIKNWYCEGMIQLLDSLAFE